MPTSINLKIVGADVVRQGLEDLSAEIPRIGRLRIYQTLVRARHTLKQPAARPTYPISWDSEKQRRYVMALLRERGTLPYSRTGRYQRGWNIVRAGDTAYRLENDAPAAEYIGGDFIGRYQSRIHQGRWAVANDVLAAEIEELPESIENNIASEAKRIFG